MVRVLLHIDRRGWGPPIRAPINDGAVKQAVLVDVKHKGRFTCMQDGDYLMTRFQECGKCHFRNIQRRDPEFGNIGRTTLDVFCYISKGNSHQD